MTGDSLKNLKSMRTTPRKQESTSLKDDDEEFKPLQIPQLESQNYRPQFHYLNPTNGYQIHQSLVTSKMFSPVGTSRGTRKKLMGESVFKTPNSRGPTSVDKKNNGFNTPESRSFNQQRRPTRQPQTSFRLWSQKDLRKPDFFGVNSDQFVRQASPPSRQARPSH